MATVLMAAYTNYRRDPRVKREAEALAELGHQVVVLARRQRGEPARERLAGVEVVKTIGLPGKPTSAAGYIADYLIFFTILAAHLLRHPRRYQLIHINNMPDFLVFATFLPRLLGTPVIHDVHDLMPELYAEKFASGEKHWVVSLLLAQERWAGRFASQVLTVEERLRDLLSRRGIRADKIHVLLNLPDDRIFWLRAPRSSGREGSRFVVVYHGTLARRLGLDLAIQAAALCKARIPALELRIIGAGEERGRLIALRDALGLQDTVHFSEGFVPVERIPEMIEDADVGVVPLRVSSGTDIMLPTKLLEYVSLGIPCIVPHTGTIRRYFDDQMVQFFEAENVSSLAEAMLCLYADRERRTRLAHEAAERFGKRYRWSEHKKVYTDLVARLLNAR